MEVEVFERQERLVAHQHLPVGINQIVQGAARLDAFSAVGGAPVKIGRQGALAAVAHAQRTVHEHLQLARNSLPDGFYRLERELPFQYQPAAAKGLVAAGVLRGADRTLGRGMQRYGDVVPAADPLVADDEGVHPGGLLEQHLAMQFRQFFVAN